MDKLSTKHFTFLFTNFTYKYRIVVCENMYKAIKIVNFFNSTLLF